MRSRLVTPAVLLLLAIVACGPLSGIIGSEDNGDVAVVATLPLDEAAPEENTTDPQAESGDSATEAPISTIEIFEAGTLGTGGEVVAMALSPDGTQLAASGAGGGASSHEIFFVDTVTGTVSPSPEERTGWGLENTMAYNPSGTIMVTVDLVRVLGAFDTMTLAQLNGTDRFDPYPGQDTMDLAWADDTSIYTLVNTGDVAQVTVPSAEILNITPVFDSGDVRDLSILANGNLLVIGADTEFDQFRSIVELSPDLTEVDQVAVQLVQSAKGSPDGSQIVIHSARNGQIFLVNSLGEMLTEPQPTGSTCNDRSDIAWSPAGNLFAITATRCSIQVYDAITGQLVYDSNDQRGGRGIAFSPDGSRLYVGTSDRGIQVYEVPVPEGFIVPTPVAEAAPAEAESPVEDAEPDPPAEGAIDADAAPEVDAGTDEFIPIPQTDAELDELPFAADAVDIGTADNFCVELLPDDQLEAVLGQTIVSRFNDDFERFGPAISCLADLEDGSAVEVIIQRFPTAYDAQLLWVEEQYFFLFDSATSTDTAFGDRGALLLAPPGEAGDTPAVAHFYVNDYYALARVVNPVEEGTALLEAFSGFVAERLAAF